MRSKSSSPWGLTPREIEVMDMVVLRGSQKAAAREMGMALKTLETHMFRAKRKLGITNSSSFQHLLKWDRFRRGECQQESRPKAAFLRSVVA